MKKIICTYLLLCFLSLNNLVLADEIKSDLNKHPKYFEIFAGPDKFEKFNRKMFNLNLKLNKIFVKNIHIVWDSIFPTCVIDAINRAYYNIEYPKRLISCIFQRDADGIKNETKRFVINTVIGVGGLIDAAYKLFGLESYDEDMEQALAKCKMPKGRYLVLPFLSSTTPRDLIGRLFDFIFTPSTYFTAPIAAAVKMALLINRTEFIQPIIYMVESNFADPYDIARKFYGLQRQIKLSNYDRKNVLDKNNDDFDDELELVDKKDKHEYLEVKGVVGPEQVITSKLKNNKLEADIILTDYNPQSPLLDSMRTALFDIQDSNKSLWQEFSVWNRSFIKQIKSASVEIVKGEPKYTFKYVLQKDKFSPLVILFPSVGEGVNSHHNTVLAKIFYDKGYSVLIFGNYFQWEFLKSLDKNYAVGNIKNDIKYVNLLVSNSIDYLSKKYDRMFLKRTALGTSLGAYAVLYLANEQYETGANNIDNFIAISPPFELSYATKKLDLIMNAWKTYPNDLKNKIALTSAKVMRALKEKDDKIFDKLPFSSYEAKLISGYIFHQKLSDLVFQIEKRKNNALSESEIYDKIYTINYSDYISNYLADNKYSKDDINIINSLRSISNFLINSNNYIIYHSLDDYLISEEQLEELKLYSDDKLKLFNHGSHLGFLYRDEFKQELINQISR